MSIYQRRDWQATRKRIIDRDRGACQICGSPVRLQVHHRDGNNENNDDANLQTLCAICHLKIEARRFAIKDRQDQEKIIENNKIKTINVIKFLRGNYGQNRIHPGRN